MLRHADTLADGAKLTAEVAVVGAGPLGITLALELARAGVAVTLIETGANKFDESAQRLSDSSGEDYFHAEKQLTVRRQVGGTSTLWGGRCVPFDSIDFDSRAVQPDATWPIDRADIAPYLERACEWCCCGHSTWNATELPELAGRMMISGLHDSDVRSTDLERWGLPTRFGAVYRTALTTEQHLDLVTGITCTEITCAPDGKTVESLALKTLDGKSMTLRADRYVLATGGLEATRLLMASNAVHPEGIGNHSGHLGRWYMAHVEARVARMVLTTPPGTTIYGHERDNDGVYVRRRFTFAAEYQQQHELLNAAIWIVNPEMGDPSHGSGILSGVYLTLVSPAGRYMLAEAIRRAGTKTSRPGTIRQHVRNIFRDFWPSVRFALSFTYSRFIRPGRKAPGFFLPSEANIYPLHYHGEHLPHWESHVELTTDRDALGLPRLRTKMHFSSKDIASVREAMQHLDAHLRANEVGYLEYLHDDIDAAVRDYLGHNAGYHQTGTTRMSTNADDGVVTADLAVHGVNNLFVASTSVLPTSSQANPTLMGVALAVRLADHLTANRN